MNLASLHLGALSPSLRLFLCLQFLDVVTTFFGFRVGLRDSCTYPSHRSSRACAAERACSVSVMRPTKPITARGARPAESCWPTGRSAGCFARTGPGRSMNGRGGGNPSNAADFALRICRSRKTILRGRIRASGLRTAAISRGTFMGPFVQFLTLGVRKFQARKT